MSQFQGCPCSTRADPRAFDIFYFFWSNSPPCGPFLLSNTPLPRDFSGVKCLPPGLSDNTQIDFRNPERGFQHCHLKWFLLFFVYQFNVYVHHFFFCVHSDHLWSRYELSVFGTLQSSVSKQQEVQEHKSVHSKFCNSRMFSKGSLPSGFKYWQISKSFVKCT